MQDLEIIKFPNKIKFWSYICELTNDIDFKNTIKLPNFWFYFTETLDIINELCYTNFDSKTSIATGSRVTLFVKPRFDKEDVIKELTGEPEIESEEFNISVDLSDFEEDLVDSESVQEDLEDVSEDTKEVDWEYAESLYNEDDKKGSKDTLEEYAREFDVELAKNKSFENMIKDFKKALK